MTFKTPCTCQLQKIAVPTSTTKTVSLIRHGQSKWNAATKSKNVVAMLAHDHPLDTIGTQLHKITLPFDPSPSSLTQTFNPT